MMENYTESETQPNATVLLIDRIHFFLVPPLVLLGTLGNLLSLACFRWTKLSRLSTSYYLTALALSDTAFLISLFAVWLEMVGVKAYNQPFLCQFVTYTSHVCCFLSPWLVVTFTVERFVATCYPLKRAAVCTVSRARTMVAVLVFIATASYSYLFAMAGDEYPCCPSYTCGLKRDYIRPMRVLNSLDTFVTLIIPVALIIGLNFQIGCAVWHFEQVRRRMTASHHNGNCSEDSLSVTSTSLMTHSTRDVDSHHVCRQQRGGGGAVATVGHGGRYQIKITKMLLMISSVFVGLNAPSYAMRLWTFHINDSSDVEPSANVTCELQLNSSCTHNNSSFDTNNDIYIMGQCFQLIFYLNFAINFLLYCVWGKNFRKALRQLLWEIKVALSTSRRDDGVGCSGIGSAGLGNVHTSNGFSRRRWSGLNTGTISTQILMTETHSLPATITKCRSATPVTTI